MTTLDEIPQNTRLMAIVSPNAAVFAWVLGGLPSCVSLFFPPALLCTVPLFIVLSGVGAFTGYRARQQMAEGPSDMRLNRAATVGLYIGLAGTVIGLLMGCVLAIGALVLGPALLNEMLG